MLTDKEKRFADKLRRYFQNEDEYNYKNVILNALNDRNFEKAIQEIATPVTTYRKICSFANDTRKYHKFFRYKPKGDDE